MTRLLISTSWRHTAHNQPSGRLLVFDSDTKKVIQSCEIIEPPYREFDPNPRGGFRGLKGISVYADRIAIANASTIFLYDQKWSPSGYIWHPSCAGIHDILLQHNHVWATSSRNDLVFCFDLSGNIVNYIDVRRFSIFSRLIKNKPQPFLSKNQIMKGKINFRDPRTHDHAITDRLHLNSFSILSNGDYLISCGLLRVINATSLHKLNNWLKQTPFSKSLAKTYRFFRTVTQKDQTIHFEDKAISKKESSSFILRKSHAESADMCLSLKECKVPSHSIRLLKDHSAVYLNSSSGELLHFNPETCDILSLAKIGNCFLRGADQMDDGSIFVGDNNYLIHYDLTKRTILSKTQITEDSAEAIFDIHKLPDDFSHPPVSFPELHIREMPVKQE